MLHVHAGTGTEEASQVVEVLSATTGPQGTRRLLSGSAPNVTASQALVGLSLVPKHCSYGRLGDGPSTGSYVKVRFQATNVAPPASSNGLGPATSAAVRAFTGRCCISSLADASIMQGH